MSNWEPVYYALAVGVPVYVEVRKSGFKHLY